MGHGFSYSDSLGHERQRLFLNLSAILSSSHRLCVNSHHIWIPHGRLGTKWVWDMNHTLTCINEPYIDMHMDLMAVLMGKADIPLLFPRMGRHKVDCTHRWSNIILKASVAFLSCVYETDGLYIPQCIVMTWWLSRLYFGNETLTHAISWLAMDIREPIFIIDLGFIGVLLSRATLSTSREWTKIQTIVSANEISY